MDGSGPRRPARPVAWTIAGVLGLPTAATLIAIGSLAAASYRSERLLTQALLWSRHLVALHELGEAAHDLVDDVERRLTRATALPITPRAAASDPSRRVLEAAERSRALADGFEPGEEREEHELGQAVRHLVELRSVALREQTPARLQELIGWYRSDVSLRIESRLREEDLGARVALEHAQARSAVLLGGAALLAIALVAAAGLLSWRLARHLVRTLGLLGAGAKRISEGDLEHRLGIAGDDELGEVAAAFDRMALALRENTVTRDELARGVAARTADLERSRSELQSNLEKLRAAQEQLVEKERMAAIGVLAAGVAHDVNSPLAFILSNLSFALRVAADRHHTPEDEAEAEAALREARDGAERVRDIVRALGGGVIAEAPCGTSPAPRSGGAVGG
jgi:C4-dicarboxylate-specific signal transduction histidine kinase